jgi:hypothetical protein
MTAKVIFADMTSCFADDDFKIAKPVIDDVIDENFWYDDEYVDEEDEMEDSDYGTTEDD